MAAYRLYFFRKAPGADGRAHRIAHATDLNCEDDAQAIREVEKHRDDLHVYMELWQRSRLVKTFEPS